LVASPKIVEGELIVALQHRLSSLRNVACGIDDRACGEATNSTRALPESVSPS
jgi:hypothetical protein